MIYVLRPEYRGAIQISILCETPDCEKQGEAINTVSGIAPEEMEPFIDAWRGETEVDYCPSCHELGILNDDTIRAEQPEERVYLATLSPLPTAGDEA